MLSKEQIHRFRKFLLESYAESTVKNCMSMHAHLVRRYGDTLEDLPADEEVKTWLDSQHPERTSYGMIVLRHWKLFCRLERVQTGLDTSRAPKELLEALTATKSYMRASASINPRTASLYVNCVRALFNKGAYTAETLGTELVALSPNYRTAIRRVWPYLETLLDDDFALPSVEEIEAAYTRIKIGGSAAPEDEMPKHVIAAYHVLFANHVTIPALLRLTWGHVEWATRYGDQDHLKQPDHVAYYHASRELTRALRALYLWQRPKSVEVTLVSRPEGLDLSHSDLTTLRNIPQAENPSVVLDRIDLRADNVPWPTRPEELETTRIASSDEIELTPEGEEMPEVDLNVMTLLFGTSQTGDA